MTDHNHEPKSVKRFSSKNNKRITDLINQREDFLEKQSAFSNAIMRSSIME